MANRVKNGQSLLENLGAAVAIGTLVVLRPLVRRWYNTWGATEAEITRPMPGDLVSGVALTGQTEGVYTRAITIAAPAAEVWGWVVQIGQGRGGLYSYERLENLIGCDIHNASTILPEFQQLQVGDPVRLGRKGYPLYKVAAITPGQILVMQGADPKTEVVAERPAAAGEPYTLSTWTMLLEPVNETTTRLIFRGWLDYQPRSLMNRLIWDWMTEPIGFVMMRKMLRGIRDQAEQHYRETAGQSRSFIPQTL